MKKLLSLVLAVIMGIGCFSGAVSASAASYIGASKAKSIALSSAHLKASQVKFTKAKLDSDNGLKVYDVEFHTSLAEYEYEINAKNGAIIDKDLDLNIKVTLSTNTYTYNGKAKKPSVTIKRNGKTISKSHYSVSYKNNTKPGKATVIMKFNGKTYAGTFTKLFTIKPKKQTVTSVNKSGTKLTVKWKKDSTVSGYQLQYSTSSSFSSNNKTVTVKGSSTTSKTINGVKSNKKYYARIRAYKLVNGKKLYGTWSSKGAAGTSSGYIGVDKAKSIALNNAGLKASQVTFTKAYMDTDNGVKVYEIEFVTSTKEYDYEINAKTGKIMDRSIDYHD